MRTNASDTTAIERTTATSAGITSETFPNEQAALKCLYLVTRSLDPKGTGQTQWTIRWKPALNAFAIIVGDRMPKPETH